MKPLSLCISRIGVKGLELVQTYPDVIPKVILNELAIKSMPMGAKIGDFTSSSIGTICFSSYIFALPMKDSRDGIAAIIAVFPNINYDNRGIHRVFSVIISKLKEKAFLNLEVLEEILPSLFEGFKKGEIKIKISSMVSLEINFDSEEKVKEKKNNLDGFAADMWD